VPHQNSPDELETKRQPGSATLGEVWNETKREWRLGPETRGQDLGKVLANPRWVDLADWGPEIFGEIS